MYFYDEVYIIDAFFNKFRNIFCKIARRQRLIKLKFLRLNILKLSTFYLGIREFFYPLSFGSRREVGNR
jgi:hypothetical protein